MYNSLLQFYYESEELIYTFCQSVGEQVSVDDILTKFPLLGISSAFKKFRTHEPLEKYEENAIINFANKYTTCTLNAATICDKTEDPLLKSPTQAEKVINIVSTVNIHNHTRACRKYETFCRFGFCKFLYGRLLFLNHQLFHWKNEKQSWPNMTRF